MRIVRRLSLTYQQVPDADQPSLKSEITDLLVKKQLTRPQARDWFQDAWKDMTVATTKGTSVENRVRADRKAPASTHAKIAQALQQRGTARVSKPITVIHTKPQRCPVVVGNSPKKDSETRSHKRKKSKEKRSRRKREVPTTLEEEIPALSPSDPETNENSAILEPAASEICEDKLTSPLPQDGAFKQERSRTPSDGTAESTQAPNGLDEYPLILVDKSSMSIRSALSCMDSLDSGWIDELSDDQKSVRNDTDDDEVDSWGSGMPRNNIFNKWNVFDDEEVGASTAIIDHVRDDDSSLPTDRESDIDSLSTNQGEDDEDKYFEIISSYHSESRQYPMFVRGDSQSTSCSTLGLEGPNAPRRLARLKSFNTKRMIPGQHLPFQGTTLII
jgi:hypothetical protein